MPRVIHFEIHADNPERAVAFYRGLFGWQISSWGGPVEYWLVKTGEPGERGIDGGIMRRHGSPPTDGAAVNAYVCTVDVADVEAFAKKAAELGGTQVVPKMAIPGVGWLVYCKDTEGNIFGLMQSDANAK
jgi:predicted enzyme related to lactoylglutathione lyase